MNLAITTTSARTWKAVKTHYIVAIAGATLALASAVGATSLSIDWGGAGPDGHQPALQIEKSHRSLVLYVVSSQEQADFVAASHAEGALERLFAGIADPDEEIVVLMITKPEDEAVVHEVLESWTAREPDSIRLVDLRHPPASLSPVRPTNASFGQLQTARTTYFLVDTQEQANTAFQIMDGRAEDVLLPPFDIVFGRTPEEKRHQQALIDQSAAAWGDAAANVIDLRDR